MNELLILDFDRTIIDLNRFIVDVGDYAGGHRQHRAELLELIKTGMYKEEDIQKFSWLKDVLEEDYAYPDAANLLTRLPKGIKPVVVTLAERGVPWQHFKRQFVPAITELPFEVTTINKGSVLGQSIEAGEDSLTIELGSIVGRFSKITLIDDNPDSFVPLLGGPVEMVYLSRPGQRYAGMEVKPPVRTIETLDELNFH